MCRRGASSSEARDVTYIATATATPATRMMMMMMKTSLLVTGLLALCSLAGAQSYVTSPAGFDYTEGSGSAYTFGSYSTGRYMFCDGEHRGTPMSLKGTAVRADNWIYTNSYGMGRTWQDVQLRVSETDYDSFERTFKNNPLTTPQLVFSAKLTWPTRSGKPPTFPAAFDYSFPFSAPWAYTGNKSICMDYQFTGGTMANNAAWTGSKTYQYYFDAIKQVDKIGVNGTKFGDYGNNGGCNDRGRPDVKGGEISTTCTRYSATYSTSNLRSRFQFAPDRALPGDQPTDRHHPRVQGRGEGLGVPRRPLQQGLRRLFVAHRVVLPDLEHERSHRAADLWRRAKRVPGHRRGRRRRVGDPGRLDGSDDQEADVDQRDEDDHPARAVLRIPQGHLLLQGQRDRLRPVHRRRLQSDSALHQVVVGRPRTTPGTSCRTGRPYSRRAASSARYSFSLSALPQAL